MLWVIQTCRTEEQTCLRWLDLQCEIVLDPADYNLSWKFIWFSFCKLFTYPRDYSLSKNLWDNSTVFTLSLYVHQFDLSWSISFSLSVLN